MAKLRVIRRAEILDEGYKGKVMNVRNAKNTRVAIKGHINGYEAKFDFREAIWFDEKVRLLVIEIPSEFLRDEQSNVKFFKEGYVFIARASEVERTWPLENRRKVISSIAICYFIPSVMHTLGVIKKVGDKYILEVNLNDLEKILNYNDSKPIEKRLKKLAFFRRPRKKIRRFISIWIYWKKKKYDFTL